MKSSVLGLCLVSLSLTHFVFGCTSSCGENVRGICVVFQSYLQCPTLPLEAKTRVWPGVPTNISVFTHDTHNIGLSFIPGDSERDIIHGYKIAFTRLGYRGDSFHCYLFNITKRLAFRQTSKPNFSLNCQPTGDYVLDIQTLPYPDPRYIDGRKQIIVNTFTSLSEEAASWQPSLVTIVNDSCSTPAKISVSFEAAPQQYNITQYKVQLHTMYTPILPKTVYKTVYTQARPGARVNTSIELDRKHTGIFRVVIRPYQSSDCESLCNCENFTCCNCHTTYSTPFIIHINTTDKCTYHSPPGTDISVELILLICSGLVMVVAIITYIMCRLAPKCNLLTDGGETNVLDNGYHQSYHETVLSWDRPDACGVNMESIHNPLQTTSNGARFPHISQNVPDKDSRSGILVANNSNGQKFASDRENVPGEDLEIESSQRLVQNISNDTPNISPDSATVCHFDV